MILRLNKSIHTAKYNQPSRLAFLRGDEGDIAHPLLEEANALLRAAALPRQQTLRATIDWSYDLLTPDEHTWLHCLSAFSGGWSLNAAEHICGPGDQVLDSLSQLVDKSLVRTSEQAGQTRYWLLETIRQYAREKLEASGSAPAVHERHLHYLAQMAQTAEPHLRDGQQLIYLQQLETEHDNF